MERGDRDEDHRMGPMVDDPLYQHHPQPQQHRQQEHDQPDSRAFRHDDYPTQYRPGPEYHSPPLDFQLDTTGIDSRSTIADNAQPAQVSSHIPPYADANTDADTSNGEIPDAVDPDDFYRSYSGVDPNSTTSPANDTSMAATASTSRGSSNSPASSHASRPPLSTLNSRTPLRPSLRSVSAPINNDQAPVNMSGAPSATKPSVRDLRRKFDQDTSSMIPRPPARSSLIHRPTHTSRSRSVMPPTGPSQFSSTAPRSPTGAVTRAQSTSASSSSTISKASQRSKAASDHQYARSGPSFASRINKPNPATEVGGSQPLSRTTMESSCSKASSIPASSPPDSISSPVLFGEILPDQRDTRAVGYGIENTLAAYGSGSKLPRSVSRHDLLHVEPSDTGPASPSDWYRLDKHPNDEDLARSQGIPTPPYQNGQETPILPSSPNPRPTSLPRPTHNSRPNSAQSRRPGSSRRFRNSTGDSSPTASGLNSPTSRGSQINGRSSRAGTPSGRRSKTPTGASAGRRGAPRSIVTSRTTGSDANNNRLNAFISTPPPKLSPPLRSSRPRQPVSVASTASSRLKSVDHNPKSPGRSSRPLPGEVDERSSRRRKVSVGNIDFEQRREHVKLAYRKSIRQSRIQDARERAARVKAMEEEAKEEAAAGPPELALDPDQPSIVLDTPNPDVLTLHIETERPADPAPNDEAESAPSPDGTVVVALDSPTLGIPGSFPVTTPLTQPEKVPQSAISVRSDFTEFDIEPQVDLAVHPVSSAALERERDVISEPNNHGNTNEIKPRQEEVLTVEATPEPPQAFEEMPSERQDQAPEQLMVEIGLEVEIGLDLGDIERQAEPQDVDISTSECADTSIPDASRGELEVIPYIPDSYETRVRILRRESDMSQYTASQQSHSSFPRAYDDSVYPLGLDTGDGLNHTPQEDARNDAATDICTDEASEVNANIEDYYSPETYSRDITFTSSALIRESFEAVHPDGSLEDGLGTQSTTNSSHMLGVPSMLMSGNRSSQHSSWTDFSIDSSEPSDGFKTRSSPSRPDPSPLLKQVEVYPRPKSITEEDPLAADAQLRRDGHVDVDAAEDGDRRVQSYLSAHQLPEVDTGDGFSIPYLSDQAAEENETIQVPQPSHEPPPLPTAAPSVDDQRHYSPPSSIYDKPCTTSIDSDRPSGDYTLGTSTPPSVGQESLEVFEPVKGGKLPSDTTETPEESTESAKPEASTKEKQRLIQRRNVVKELIDTEAVFVRDMNIVEEIYKGTAEACPELDANTVKLVFRNTDEIIHFHAMFLGQLKEAVAPVYQMVGRNSTQLVPEDPRSSAMTASSSASHSATAEPDDKKDRLTAIGPVFTANIEAMKVVHEGFLRSSDHAAKRLIQIQQDKTVKVWLNECNEVAKDLTAAWDLDSLLIKPMQRITKYPNIITTLLQHTPEDHPDRPFLLATKDALETAIIEINKTKKNFELVGQIVGRKRKESDVKAGFARAFGKRVDKLQGPANRSPDDAAYRKLRERFNDDYLRLQVVLRDVEFYTRQVSAYVHEFLQYLSSMELVMRLQPSPYPEMESKWVQFNVSMRDIQKVALEQHLSHVRKDVIEPFELVIKAYGNPSLAMKKRAKRRLDFERAEQIKKGGKAVDFKLNELVEQYDALNDTLKKELPKLSELTVKIGNIAMGNFVNLQASWYKMWKDKVKVVLGDVQQTPEIPDILSAFQRDYQYAREAVIAIAIVNPTYMGRPSHSKSASIDDSNSISNIRHRPAELPLRSRGPSVSGEGPPSLPTPDFAGRNSDQFALSPASVNAPSPYHYYYRDYYAGISSGYRSGGGASPNGPDLSHGSRSQSMATAVATPRPGSGRSMESASMPRESTDSSITKWRDSSSTSYNTGYSAPEAPRRFSGLFHSALPLPDEAEESQRSSRASSRERAPANSGYNILWLAASLFEFNIETTKHEAGYPYLVYQAGEIFDVIAEKGELWLAKNQDDSRERVGWIWSKHFAKLADS